MQRLGGFVMLAVVCGLPLCAAEVPSPFAGRWDLTIVTSPGVTSSGISFPSWMEFADERARPAIRVVGRTGSVHPVHNVVARDDRLTFDDGPGQWRIFVKDHKLTGQTPQGQLTGVPAPALNRQVPAAWTNAEPLFNGRDLTGWQPDNPTLNHWRADKGELQNLEAGANIATTRNFADFKLHIEYNCPPGGNSGVYLRGRYEVQVEYEPAVKNDVFHAMGSIYGFIAPTAEVLPRPGQWETYDVTLVGRNVTVIRDGVVIIDHGSIPGITGGARDSHEAEPGPIYLQGDHTGGLKYRNITISLPQR